ncbi:hypothetical protein DRN74_01945 [Candidatus Micrarchaeota archaeon]|nr:MAG: hypothetical protein DRN74_01945 [Candidatus Micrarchaeota archaeon]
MDESQKQVVIFVTLIVFMVVAFGILWFFNMLNITAILLIIFFVLFVTWTQAPNYFAQLQEYERAVVFRMGKFKKEAGPGWLFVIPYIESFRRVDLRVKTIDIPVQEVVTHDNIKLKIDAIIYLRVKSATKAVLNVRDYEKAAVSFTQARLRDVVGKMKLADVISNVDVINKHLKAGLQEVADDWGISVENIEIQSITLPKGVQEAMHQLKEAEQKKLAAKELAEGTKIKINALQEAAGKLTDPTLNYLYLQSLQKIAEGKSSKIIFPMELSKLAENISHRFGGDYEKAQEKALADYRELVKDGAKKETILEALRKGKLSKKSKKRSKKSNDFLDMSS